MPFAAGNFIDSGASDLVPEVKQHRDPAANIQNFLAFLLGVALMLAIRVALEV